VVEPGLPPHADPAGRRVKRHVEPTCESIEPVSRDVQCMRTASHCGMHWAVYRAEDGGRVTVEWHDAAFIREYLKKITMPGGEAHG
jgi:hypothetical protein